MQADALSRSHKITSLIERTTTNPSLTGNLLPRAAIRIPPEVDSLEIASLASQREAK